MHTYKNQGVGHHAAKLLDRFRVLCLTVVKKPEFLAVPIIRTQGRSLFEGRLGLEICPAASWLRAIACKALALRGSANILTTSPRARIEWPQRKRLLPRTMQTRTDAPSKPKARAQELHGFSMDVGLRKYMRTPNIKITSSRNRSISDIALYP